MSNDVTVWPRSSGAMSGVTVSPPAWLEPLILTAASVPWGELHSAPARAIELAKVLLPDLAVMWPPASIEQRATALVMLADHCAVTADHAFRSGDEKRIERFFDAYHEDLRHVPAAALDHACRVYRQTPVDKGKPKWYPGPDVLLKLANEHAGWKAHRVLVRGVSRLAQSKPERAFVPSTPEQEAEIAARLAAFRTGSR